jgi:hypothetical protein
LELQNEQFCRSFQSNGEVGGGPAAQNGGIGDGGGLVGSGGSLRTLPVAGCAGERFLLRPAVFAKNGSGRFGRWVRVSDAGKSESAGGTLPAGFAKSAGDQNWGAMHLQMVQDDVI